MLKCASAIRAQEERRRALGGVALSRTLEPEAAAAAAAGRSLPPPFYPLPSAARRTMSGVSGSMTLAVHP